MTILLLLYVVMINKITIQYLLRALLITRQESTQQSTEMYTATLHKKY